MAMQEVCSYCHHKKENHMPDLHNGRTDCDFPDCDFTSLKREKIEVSNYDSTLEPL